MPVLVEDAAAHEHPATMAKAVVKLYQPILRVYVVGGIDRTAGAGRDQNVPIRRHQLRTDQARPLAGLENTEQRVVGGRFRSVARGKLQVIAFRPHGNNTDHAANRT